LWQVVDDAFGIRRLLPTLPDVGKFE